MGLLGGIIEYAAAILVAAALARLTRSRGIDRFWLSWIPSGGTWRCRLSLLLGAASGVLGVAIGHALGKIPSHSSILSGLVFGLLGFMVTDGSVRLRTVADAVSFKPLIDIVSLGRSWLVDDLDQLAANNIARFVTDLPEADVRLLVHAWLPRTLKVLSAMDVQRLQSAVDRARVDEQSAVEADLLESKGAVQAIAAELITLLHVPRWVVDPPSR